MMDAARKTMTVIEAAACLGLSRNATYQAVREGAIPAIRVGRRILVPTNALETFLSGPALRQPVATAV